MRSLCFALSLTGSLAARRAKSNQGVWSSSRNLGRTPVFELQGETHSSDTWIVHFDETAKDSTLVEFCKGLNCENVGHPDAGGLAFVALRSDEEGLSSALRRSNAPVDHVHPDYALKVDLDPSREDAATAEAEAGPASDHWGLDRIGDRSATGKGVHVYVFDSGVRVDHAEFRNRAIKEIDMSGGKLKICSQTDASCAEDDIGHGTHVAGTVAGIKYGVAPEAIIHVMKMDFATADRGVSNALVALDWLLQNAQKPAILQMSFGWPRVFGSLKTPIEKLQAAEVNVVIAAGNSRGDACGFTWGNFPTTITVGATDKNDKAASFTNKGECLDLFAPGVSILSADFGSSTGFTAKSGTSMAAPMTSGVVALILEKNPSFTPQQVKDYLVRTSAKDVVQLSLFDSKSPNRLLQAA